MALKTNRRKNKPLTDEEKINREFFEEKLKEHSIEALNTIVFLMNNSFDNNVRFKASKYLLDKVMGTEFSVFENKTENDRELIVTIRTENSDSIEIDNDWIERQIEEIEQDNDLDDDEQDDWGSEIYLPDKKPTHR